MKGKLKSAQVLVAPVVGGARDQHPQLTLETMAGAGEGEGGGGRGGECSLIGLLFDAGTAYIIHTHTHKYSFTVESEDTHSIKQQKPYKEKYELVLETDGRWRLT